MANVPDSLKKEVIKLGSSIKDSISTLKEMFLQHKEVKGIQRNPNTLNNYLFRAISYIESNRGAPGQAALISMDIAQKETDKLLEKVKTLFNGPWKEYRQKSEAIQYSLFKEFD